MNATVIQKIQEAPTEPGVYTFYRGAKVLYIGKASNLKNRLKSYLPASGGSKITDIKTEMLHEEADRLEYLILNSEIEALIEESRLIKERKPKLNVLWMDDKSYHYVHFTNDAFPKIYIGHEKPKRIMNNELRIKRSGHNSSFKIHNSSKVGPFTDGGMLRTVMKILRRPLPYCTCMQAHLRDCLNAQIGQCLGTCCKKETTNDKPITYNETPKTNNQYLKNIRAIKAILTGKKTLKNITDEKELSALTKIQEHRDFVSTSEAQPDATISLRRRAMPADFNLSSIKKVECYDNSNFAGKEAVGAMTVLVKQEAGIMNQEWVADKGQWRKFKIKSAPTRDDPRMIGEILSRRLNHPEWPYPDLIVIDGGITQYRAAKKVLSRHPEASSIKLVSYAKPQQLVIGIPAASKELRELIEKSIYQTHRFVINYHRNVRAKAFLP